MDKPLDGYKWVQTNPMSELSPVYAMVPADMEQKEVLAYCELITSGKLREDEKGSRIKSLTISYLPDDNVDLDYEVEPVGFVRIRRITGYLVGSLDRFGNAKRAEEHDRVKHISCSVTAA